VNIKRAWTEGEALTPAPNENQSPGNWLNDVLRERYHS